MNTHVIKHEKGKINIVFNNHTLTKSETQQKKVMDLNEFKLIDNHFTSYIGLDHIKEIVKQIFAMKIMNEKRSENALTTNRQVLHMVFKGNPGTGKTTVARELGKLFFKLNILSKGHFVEAERADIVGEYIGQTAQKTRAIVQKALGGILFIDEAYSLVRGGRKDFGREAIDTLVKQMEDYNSDFILILAGYPNEMNTFNLANPGLQSRFPFHITFKDYKVNELIAIAEQMANDKEYQLTDSALQKMESYLQNTYYKKTLNFSNARFIRNVIEQAIRLQAVRLLHSQAYDVRDLVYLTSEDFQFE